MENHIHSVTFGGQNLSTAFRVYPSGNESFNTPERAVEVVEVPGKNGDLTFDLGRFKNIEVSYPCFIAEDLETNLNALTAFLGSQKGYKKLEDTYHPSYYRMGMFIGPLEQEIILLQAGVFTLTFNCKPQKFLTSGDTVQSFTSDSSITNPTLYDSKPLLRVYGNGTVGIGAFSFTVTNNANSNLYIDCETMDCYRGSTNCNSYVTFTDNTFPVLVPGSNGIDLGSGITQVKITPRWWTI